MLRRVLLAVLYLVSAVQFVGCQGNGTGPESDPVFDSFPEEVQYLIDSEFTRGGVAVGVIRDSEEFTIFRGVKNRHSSDPPDAETVFELGSITKTFTGLLLSILVLEEKVELADEIRIYLPQDQVHVPTYNGIPITLLHLATHTSGLPTNFTDDFPLPEGTPSEDPFALIQEEHIYDYLSHYATLSSAPGTTYHYSNFGYGLLGHILSRVDSSPLTDMMRTRICDELGMTRTSYALSNDQLANMAVGHDSNGREVEPWGNSHALIGCGGLWSSLEDMMVYLKANMGLLATPLSEAMEQAQQVYFDTYVGLGWQKRGLTDGQVITWFAGASAGHITYIAFHREYQTGVVILYNIGQNLIPLDVGKRIMQIARRY